MFLSRLNDGDFVTVIGGNGAGKSTLLNAMAGVWPVDRGQHRHRREMMSPRLPEHKRAVYLGRVFQDPMTGTAATMGIRGKSGTREAPWKADVSPSRYHEAGAGGIR